MELDVIQQLLGSVSTTPVCFSTCKNEKQKYIFSARAMNIANKAKHAFSATTSSQPPIVLAANVHVHNMRVQCNIAIKTVNAAM